MTSSSPDICFGNPVLRNQINSPQAQLFPICGQMHEVSTKLNLIILKRDDMKLQWQTLIIMHKLFLLEFQIKGEI